MAPDRIPEPPFANASNGLRHGDQGHDAGSLPGGRLVRLYLLIGINV